MTDGRFIVLEGLDGAGTTTQTRRLHEYFTKRGSDSFPTCEPTPEPVGAFTRSLLSGDAPPPQRVLGLLFAADRLQHSATIRNHLAGGRHVLCDRYIFSSMAYQTLDPDISAEWVRDVNAGCAVPDLTVFVDVPVEECLRRLGGREGDRSIYERADHLQTILDNYRRLTGFYEAHFGTLVTVDGTGSPDAVHAAIVSALQR